MRNKYNKKFENIMLKLAPNNNLDDLLLIAQKEYNITKNQLRQYLSKRKIRYKDYNSNKAHPNNLLPIGTEYTKDDGMTLIKISQDKWEYKQRFLYKKYHNCELTSDDYIIFLNQNRNDFSKNNLAKISRAESSILSNQKMFSKNKNLTKLGIITAKLILKIKERHNNGKN